MWSSPQVVGANPLNDQWFPSVTFLSDGRLAVGMNDRSLDPANHTFAYSLFAADRERLATQNVSCAMSDPTKDNRWFTGGQIFPNFPYPTTFIGDTPRSRPPGRPFGRSGPTCATTRSHTAARVTTSS